MPPQLEPWQSEELSRRLSAVPIGVAGFALMGEGNIAGASGAPRPVAMLISVTGLALLIVGIAVMPAAA